ncbi:MAG: hypothetical protein KBC22_01300 [Candidatus Pacebacteria bacterium]|nr:hypothetical protein [Candidatus Paceibacterota bacterium]
MKNTQEHLSVIMNQLERPFPEDRFDNPAGIKILQHVHTIASTEDGIEPASRSAILALIADLQVSGYSREHCLERARVISDVLRTHTLVKDPAGF